MYLYPHNNINAIIFYAFIHTSEKIVFTNDPLVLVGLDIHFYMYYHK
jgi:hypothetical protein